MASRSVNKVILIGNLGRDAETKFTPQGTAVTRFSVGTNRNYKDSQTGEWKEEANWTNVTLWKAENLANYLTKGKQVYVEGRLHTRSYEDKDGKKVWATEVVAEQVILLGGGRGGDTQAPQDSEYASGGYSGGGGGPVSMPRSARQQPQQQTPAPQHDDFGQGVSEDDVPF